MKTLQQWHESKVNLDEFLKAGDEIDEEMYYYFLEVLPPIYHPNLGVFQVSEPFDTDPDGHFTYGTYQKIRDLDEKGDVVEKYYYRGNLTIKQAKLIK